MTKKYKINLLDLFSGIGGFHLGLEKAGFKVNSYFSEIDKYAIEVYKHNFKNSTYVKSVKDVRGDQLPRIDAISFGSPCQDFSVAGKGKGLKGNRSSLIGEAIRLICECRPSFFIWENVKGTFSSNNSQDFWAIIQAFANIGGYRLEWQLLNTKWFLPQNRERIYLVGYTPGQSRGQIFPIGQSFGEATKGIVSALSATDYKQPKQIKIKTNNSKGYEIAKHGDTINYQNLKSNTRRGRVGKGIAQTLDSGCEQAVIAAQRGRNLDNPSDRRKGIELTQRLEINKEGISNTLSSVQKDNYVITNSIRKLTPIECERLQGFPDNWTYANGISDSQRYKMIGNAVTVDVVEAVGQRIKNVLYE